MSGPTKRKRKIFAIGRALDWLVRCARRHRDPKQRAHAEAILELLTAQMASIDVAPGEVTRKRAALRGAQRTAEKARRRADAMRAVAEELRRHGVPEDELVMSVREAWRDRRMEKPVPSHWTIKRALKG